MSELYNSLEGDIIRIMIKRLKGGPKDITNWQAQKLSELRLFNNDVVKYLAEVTPVAEKEILKMFQAAGRDFVKDVDNYMPFAKKPMPNNLDTIMKGYHDQVWSDIDNYINQTLVTTHYGLGTAQRAYQTVLNQTSAAFNSGLYTLEQSVERSVMQLAQKGISSTFIDRGGHTWSLERYVRTVLKSTLGNTYDKVRKDRMAEYDVHTVVVSSHVGARQKCSVIQGNVVDLRYPEEIPSGSEYLSVYDDYWGADYEMPSGHRGINCRHLHIPFIPGVNTNNQPKYDQELNERVAKARDTQRRIEREITKYKKNLMVAEHFNGKGVPVWRDMVSRRQKAMRELLKENGDYLNRDYRKEKVYTPLSTLLKDFSYD